jgi:methylglutaconyl-CoA hydratase
MSTTPAAVEDPKNMVLCNVDSEGFATVTLNRPEMFNAFSDVVIARCSEIFDALRKEKGKHCV